MAGETDLAQLLVTMRPVLDPALYVFATCHSVPAGLEPRMLFQEEEGITLILEEGAAQAAGLDYDFPCRRITLTVHSSLEAVGFIAQIARHLAAAGMGVNPVSGYYHDHLFLPADRADEAMALLAALAG